MSRFDSMISKGVNTYDADATDADILQGKTAYVAGEKVTGTLVPSGGGGELDTIGWEIDVEAETTISAGDSIVARENNQYVTPTAVLTSIPVDVLTLSDDGSVGIGYEGYSSIPNTSVLNDGSVINIYFRNEAGNFDTDNMYSITLSNYPISSTILSNMPVLNDEGTLAIISNYQEVSGTYQTENIAIVIEIDKQNKTASYSYKTFEKTHVDYGHSTYYLNLSGLRIMRKADYYPNQIIFKGNYIIATVMAYYMNKSDDTMSSNKREQLMLLKYENGSFILLDPKFGMYGNGSSINNTLLGNIADYGDTLLIPMGTATNSGYIYKYVISTKTLTRTSQNLTRPAFFSKNGRYCVGNQTSYVHLYSINTLDYTFTLIYTFNTLSQSSFHGKPTNDGNYVYVFAYGSSFGNAGIYENINGTYTIAYRFGGVNSNCKPPLTHHFEMPVVYMDKTIGAVVPGTNAQYLISSTNSRDCSTADRIYGVASHNLAVGTRGKARGLFSTMT